MTSTCSGKKTMGVCIAALSMAILFLTRMNAQSNIASESVLIPATAKSADARNVKWGQKYKAVLELEKAAPNKEFKGGAVFRMAFADEKGAQIDLFLNKETTLTNTAYYFHRPIGNAPQLGDLYTKLKAELTKLYGKPTLTHAEGEPPTAEQISNLESGKTLGGKAIVKTDDPLKNLMLNNIPVVFYCSYTSWETARTSIRLDIEASTEGTTWIILLYTAKLKNQGSRTAATTSKPLFSYTDADRYKDLIMSQATEQAGIDDAKEK